MPGTITGMQMPKSGELFVTCPMCRATVKLEPVYQEVMVTTLVDEDGQLLRTSVNVAAHHVCDHVHHFVPKSTGQKISGVMAYILICSCGTPQGEGE